MIPHADFIITRRDVQRFADSGAFECFAFPDGVQQVQFLDLCRGEPTEERLQNCIWALRFDEQPDAHRRRVYLGLCFTTWVGRCHNESVHCVYATLQDWLRGNASDDMLRAALERLHIETREGNVMQYLLKVALQGDVSEQCNALATCARIAWISGKDDEAKHQMTAMRNIWSDPTRLPEHDKPEPDDEGEDDAPEPEAPLDPLDVLAELKADAAMQATAYTEADAHRDAQAYADSVRQALKEDAAIPAYVKANIAALRTEVAALQDTISTMQAEQAMHRMFFALVDVHRRLNAIEAEEKAVKQGLIATAAKARALGVQVPAPIAEAK